MSKCIAYDGATQTLETLSIADLDENAIYIFSTEGGEARIRTGVWADLLASRPGQCVEISDQLASSFVVTAVEGKRSISLTDSAALHALFVAPVAYVDITGLNHGVWASLLRAMLDNKELEKVFYVYSEPDVYQAHQSPSSSNLFDLTAAFGGISPLPGMANLSGPERGLKSVLVSFLGFESSRASHIAQTFDSLPKVVPVIGLPGFRIDYPQITVASNKDYLDETKGYYEVKFARASCPFEAYSVLADISRDNPGSYLYIAPIGTKPHALGAVWYAIDHPRETEIIYDNPVRKKDRSAGIGQTHIFQIKPRDADL